VGPGQLGAQRCTPEALDRLAIEAVRRLVLAQQRASARLQAEAPVGGDDLVSLGDSRQGALCEVDLAAAGGGFDKLAQSPAGNDELGGVFGRRLGRPNGLRMAAEAVQDDGQGPARVLDVGSLAGGLGLGDSGVDQRRQRLGPRKAVRKISPYGATGVPVASVTVSASEISCAAFPKSPLIVTAWARMFSATASTVRAPVSVASWTARPAAATQVS
jgi:hypothetical protein